MIFDISLLHDPVVICLLGAIALLVLWIIRLEIKMKHLLVGKNARSLEDSILHMQNGLADLTKFKTTAITAFTDVDDRLARSIQAVETIRFNPFKGTGEGGNQSFSTSFVSEKGDGVVISSLYSRERVSVFSKPLKDFASTFDLTEEEQEVVEGAKKKLT